MEINVTLRLETLAMKATSIFSFFFFFFLNTLSTSFLFELSWLFFFVFMFFTKKTKLIYFLLIVMWCMYDFLIVVKTAVLLIREHCSSYKYKNSMHNYHKGILHLLVKATPFFFFLFFLICFELTDFLHAPYEWRSAFFGVAVHVALRQACVAVELLSPSPHLCLTWLWPWSSVTLYAWMPQPMHWSLSIALGLLFLPHLVLYVLYSRYLFPEVAPDCQCGFFEHPL